MDLPRAAVQAMARAGVLGAVLSANTDLAAFGRAVEIEQSLAYNPGPLRRLAALTVNQTSDLRDRFRLSNNQTVHLAGVACQEKIHIINVAIDTRQIHACEMTTWSQVRQILGMDTNQLKSQLPLVEGEFEISFT